jgi:hypothetical protein
MKKVKMLIVAMAVAVLSIMPGVASPAHASHNCALEDVDHTVDTICDHYHDPKPLLEYLICLISPTC